VLACCHPTGKNLNIINIIFGEISGEKKEKKKKKKKEIKFSLPADADVLLRSTVSYH
jgi:hypothetical protein